MQGKFVLTVRMRFGDKNFAKSTLETFQLAELIDVTQSMSVVYRQVWINLSWIYKT